MRRPAARETNRDPATWTAPEPDEAQRETALPQRRQHAHDDDEQAPKHRQFVDSIAADATDDGIEEVE
jgi:hypothetical protein